jgi:hypothetical protein
VEHSSLRIRACQTSAAQLTKARITCIHDRRYAGSRSRRPLMQTDSGSGRRSR